MPAVQVNVKFVLPLARAKPVGGCGITPSTTRALFAFKELVAAGAGNVNVATFPTPSTIVPPFNAKAVVLV